MYPHGKRLECPYTMGRGGVPANGYNSALKRLCHWHAAETAFINKPFLEKGFYFINTRFIGK